MRLVLWLAALLLLVGAHAQMPPLPSCTEFSPTVHATSAVAAGAEFTTAVSCPSSNVTQCRCLVHTSTVNNIYYGASNTRAIAGDTCTCTFTALRDTPANILSFDNCVVCAE